MHLSERAMRENPPDFFKIGAMRDVFKVNSTSTGKAEKIRRRPEKQACGGQYVPIV